MMPCDGQQESTARCNNEVGAGTDTTTSEAKLEELQAEGLDRRGFQGGSLPGVQ